MVATTCQPLAANSLAEALPMPELAPVIKMVLLMDISCSPQEVGAVDCCNNCAKAA
jgi:hypothetical protein